MTNVKKVKLEQNYYIGGCNGGYRVYEYDPNAMAVHVAVAMPLWSQSPIFPSVMSAYKWYAENRAGLIH